MSLAANQIFDRAQPRDQTRPAERSLLPSFAEIFLVAGLVGLYLLASASFDEDIYPTINLIGPMALSLIMIFYAVAMIKQNGRILWTALFWFRLSSMAYFGFGSFIIYLVDDEARTYLEGFFHFSDYDIFKLNLIVAVSVLLVLVSARVGMLVYQRLPAVRRQTPARRVMDGGRVILVAAMIFLGTGLTVNYLVVVPSRMGSTGVILPGVFANFAQFTPIGVFLITLWALRYARSLLVPILLFVGIEMTLSILLFMKATMLMLLIMVSLAFLWDKVSKGKLILFAGIVVFAFAAISPVISNARYEIKQRYGANTQAGFAERFEILQLSLSSQATSQDADERQSGILRLSYVNVATFVIQLHDTGNSSDWPRLIPAVFVPRIFWPDKPVISDIGLDTYELSRGHRSSSAGAGLFAEAYWAMGWLGVFIFVPAYGFIIGFLTKFSADTLRDEKWVYAPVVLMALYMGFRTDGHYITDVAGASVILVALYIGLRIVNELVKLFLTSPTRPAG